jgi:hypothetical protein
MGLILDFCLRFNTSKKQFGRNDLKTSCHRVNVVHVLVIGLGQILLRYCVSVLA